MQLLIHIANSAIEMKWSSKYTYRGACAFVNGGYLLEEKQEVEKSEFVGSIDFQEPGTAVDV